MNIVAIIPAKGNSSGLLRKNVQDFCGRPLIAHTIQQAQESHTVSRVIVSTEDHEIAEISRSCGAEVPFMRPIELTSNDVVWYPILQHALRQIESNDYRVDWVVALSPTYPLREKRTD